MGDDGEMDAPAAGPPPFEALDFVYTPSADVAADAAYFSDVLGGRAIFRVEGMGARAALIDLTGGPPFVLLTDHLVDARPILVYRVADLSGALADMAAHGWERVGTLEIPHGPCCSFVAPGGQRVALYQLTRPEAANHFDGRFDF
jgi:hypothetical protein